MPLSLLKTLSYGVMHMTLAILVAYILSGRWEVALAIGLVEPCVQTTAFYIHERVWHRIERRRANVDHHDAVIDSVSPAAEAIETLLKRHDDEANPPRKN
jgi:uncharacterized membrane protein